LPLTVDGQPLTATYAVVVTVVAVVLGVTVAAAALPAWRASRVDPASVLREG
jgi:ABC-type lipoprotein release transport system permease subunit